MPMASVTVKACLFSWISLEKCFNDVVGDGDGGDHGHNDDVLLASWQTLWIGRLSNRLRSHVSVSS